MYQAMHLEYDETAIPATRWRWPCFSFAGACGHPLHLEEEVAILFVSQRMLPSSSFGEDMVVPSLGGAGHPLDSEEALAGHT